MKEKIFNALPYLVLLAGLLNTGFFWHNSRRSENIRQELKFNNVTAEMQQAIRDRLQSYVDELVAGAAFLKSSDKVTQQEWKQFVEALKLDVYYPGINGFGYAVPVLKSEADRVVRNFRKEVSPDFKITSLNGVPEAKDLFLIKFIEPKGRNLNTLGFDMGSEQTRRMAMERARDTGEPAVTTRVELVQDKNKLPGFLIYVPVFQSSDSARQNFLGWSFAPFIAKHFMAGILSETGGKANKNFKIELYDGPDLKPGNLLYRNHGDDFATDKFTYRKSFPVYGHNWTLQIKPAKDFLASSSPDLSILILIGGVLLSLLLFFLLQSLANTRRKAIALAETMTIELRALNRDLDKKVEERTRELAIKNEKLNLYAEQLKNSYEDLEVKVKFRNRELEKQIRHLQDENAKLKGN